MKPKLPTPAKLKTLAQQNTDFTAEGSPPPGKVATEVPAAGAAVVAPLKRPASRSDTQQPRKKY